MTEKCNWVNVRFCEMHMVKDGERVCSTGCPCEHKALTTAEPVPVVEYWRHGSEGDSVCKTVDGIIAECFGRDWPDSAIGNKLLCETCLSNPITEAAYEAARKPAVDVRDARRRHLDALADEPAIEPLDDRDYGRAELKAKMNKLIARVNALEGK